MKAYCAMRRHVLWMFLPGYLDVSQSDCFAEYLREAMSEASPRPFKNLKRKTTNKETATKYLPRSDVWL